MATSQLLSAVRAGTGGSERARPHTPADGGETPAAPRSWSPASGSRLEWPLTGREPELHAIHEALSVRPSGGVLLAGEQGTGKTRLAREAVEIARRQGALTRWAAATASGTAIPLGALSHLLPSPEQDLQPSAFTLNQAMEALLERAQGRRLVLGVDDAHLLDDSSATLLHKMVLTGGVSLVLTVRRGREAPDAVVALWRDQLVDRLEVRPLTGTQVVDLVSSVLGGPLEGSFVDRLWRLTRGNPLLVREVVEGAMNAGQLVERWGVWMWPGEFVPTPRLSELVSARLAGLQPDERSLVEALAFAEPLSASVAAGVASWEALGRADDHGLVSVEHDGRRCQVRLAHAIYREVVRAEQPFFRAQWVRKALIALEARHPPRRWGDTVRLAALHLAAEGTGDPDLLVDAATQVNVVDPGLAERMAAAAVEAGSGFDGQVALGAALCAQRRFDEAENAFQRAVSLARTDRQKVESAMKLACTMFWGRGAAEAAEAVLERAEASLVETDAARRLMVLRSSFALFRGRPCVAIRTLSPLLAGVGPSDEVAVPGAAVLSHALARTGRLTDAMAASRRGCAALPQDHCWEDFRPALTHSQVTSNLLAGRFDDAGEVARAFHEYCLAHPTHGNLPIASMLAGHSAVARGLPVTAAGHFQEAVGVMSDEDPGVWLYWSLLGLTEALALTGDAARARPVQQRAEACRRGVLVLWECDELLAQAWVRAAMGELTRAVSLATEAAAAAAATGQATMEAVALHATVRLGSRDASAVRRLEELAEEVDSPLVAASGAHAAAWMADDGAGLDSAAACFEALGARLLAAEAANQAALAHRREGRRASALASSTQAQRLASMCEGARTPALQRTAEQPALTRREREVAGLAARGLSNRAIAERLVVSVRTVEGHLEQAYAKLGLHTRTDLAVAMGVVGEGATEETDPSAGG